MAMVVGLLLLLLLLLTHRDRPCGGCRCRRCVLFLIDRRSEGGNYLERALEFWSDADIESDTDKTKNYFRARIRNSQTFRRSDIYIMPRRFHLHRVYAPIFRHE